MRFLCRVIKPHTRVSGHICLVPLRQLIVEIFKMTELILFRSRILHYHFRLAFEILAFT